MMSDMPPQDIELSEWAKAVPVLLDGKWVRVSVPIWTVRGWVKMPDFPPEKRWIGNARMWRPSDLDRWKKAHPTLGLGRGGHKRREVVHRSNDDDDYAMEVIEVWDR